MRQGASPARRSGWRLWLVALGVVATLALGTVGYWRYERALHPDAFLDPFSILYHAAQLLILHAPHLDHAVPWELHAGRLLGAGLFFAAALAASLKLFRDELLLLRLRLPTRRPHVVICGLGDLGLRLALDGRRLGRFIVGIEKAANRAALEQARASGILVLEGDACDVTLLRKTRLDRADFVVAACAEDETNVALSALVGSLVDEGQGRSKPLECRLLVRDPTTRALLAQKSIFPHSGSRYRVNVGDLDYHGVAARQALRLHPLDFKPIEQDDDTQVRLVVIGFGLVGQSLALHAARIGHFVNEVTRSIRLVITVIGPDAAAWEAFRQRHPNLDKVCDATFESANPCDPARAEQLIQASKAGNTLVTYAVCTEDDALDLRLGLELAHRTKDRNAQTLAHQWTRCGFAALLPPEGRGAAVSVRLHPFGMKEDVFAWDVLLRESEDALARGLYDDYRRRHGGPVWEELTEGMKDSNRQAADHVAIKLRALGYHEELRRRDKVRIQSFTPEETLLLAKLEHVRWCAERWLDGWECGPVTDREKKVNRCLVPWELVPSEEKDKDPEQIRAIPDLLFRLGRGIYR